MKGILVTGTHRSGTTWVGRMLSIPQDVVYIQEPFNTDGVTAEYKLPLKYSFSHIPDVADPDALFQQYARMLKFKLYPEYPDSFNWHFKVRCQLLDRLASLPNRILRKTPLVKDPIALLAAEELADRFDLRVVCMIRHPLAFCGSNKKWNWDFPFSHFLNQPHLMEDRFAEHKEIIQEYAEVEQNLISQSILLWNLLYGEIRRYQETRPDWIFLRHEDVVQDPLTIFKRIYENLGLSWTQACVDAIEDSGSSKAGGETQDASFKSRNHASVVNTWKKRLTEDEVRRIWDETHSLRTHFYPEDIKEKV